MVAYMCVVVGPQTSMSVSVYEGLRGVTLLYNTEPFQLYHMSAHTHKCVVTDIFPVPLLYSDTFSCSGTKTLGSQNQEI